MAQKTVNNRPSASVFKSGWAAFIDSSSQEHNHFLQERYFLTSAQSLAEADSLGIWLSKYSIRLRFLPVRQCRSERYRHPISACKYSNIESAVIVIPLSTSARHGRIPRMYFYTRMVSESWGVGKEDHRLSKSGDFLMAVCITVWWVWPRPESRFLVRSVLLRSFCGFQ